MRTQSYHRESLGNKEIIELVGLLACLQFELALNLHHRWYISGHILYKILYFIDLILSLNCNKLIKFFFCY